MQYNAKPSKVTPQIIKACPHPYFWRVHFCQGTEISQYDQQGKEALYKEVLDKIEAGSAVDWVAWIPTKKGFLLFRQEIDSTWQRPVVFRRHFVKPSTKEHRIMFALGWQATINGRNYKSVAYIDAETGQVIITSWDW